MQTDNRNCCYVNVLLLCLFLALIPSKSTCRPRFISEKC